MLPIKFNKKLGISSIVVVLIGLLFVYLPTTHSTGIMQEHIKIPATIDGSVYNLEAMVYKPKAKGAYPLILINHGRSTKPEERKLATIVNNYKVQAETLAEKGFTVVVPVRRGYGKSEGPDAEYSKANTIYQAGLEGAKDVTEVVNFMGKQSYVDKEHVILIGQSCGGLVSIASTTKDIPGLIGVVNFAGGLRHTSTNDPNSWTTADEGNLLKTYNAYGQKSKVPTIWIYTKNDSYFPPNLSSKMCNSFINGGGIAKFYWLPAFGKDGHKFFPSEGTIPTWMPMFEELLKTLHIPTSRK